MHTEYADVVLYMIYDVPQCISNWNPNDLLLSGGWAGPFGGFSRPKNYSVYLDTSFLCVTCVPKITQTTNQFGQKFYIFEGVPDIYIYI